MKENRGQRWGLFREKAGEQGGQGQALVGLVHPAGSLRFISVLKVKPPIILNKGWPRPLFGRIMSETASSSTSLTLSSAKWKLANVFTSLSLSFLSCKMGLLSPVSQGGHRSRG